ncbi:MAG: PucR family transcriptional regulator [Eubacterium aggregans]
MRISMYLLLDWFADYDKEVYIKEGKPDIQHVCFFPSDGETEADTLYIGGIKEFFVGAREGVLCSHGKDTLLFPGFDSTTVYDVYNKILATFDYYKDWDEKLKLMIFRVCTIRAMLDESREVFRDNHIVVMDASYMVLVTTIPFDLGEGDLEYYHSLEQNHFPSFERIAQYNRELSVYERNQTPYVHRLSYLDWRTMYQNLFSGEELVGFISVGEINTTFTKGRCQLLQVLGRRILTWKEYNADDSELTSQSHVFLEILEGGAVDKEEIVARLNAIGWMAADEKLLIRIRTEVGDRILHSVRCIIDNTFVGGYTFEYKGAIMLIVNLAQFPESVMFKELMELLNTSDTSCRVSYPFKNVFNLSSYYLQADMALTYGAKSEGRVHRCEDYALYYAMDVLQENLTTDIRHLAVRVLKAHDRKNDTQYYETLREFLLHERNQLETAKVLFIHRNTLLYRLQRIKDIFDVDLENIQTRNHLMLSFLLDEAKERDVEKGY